MHMKLLPAHRRLACRILAGAVLLPLFARPSRAQGLATPVSHWGGYMLPAAEPGTEWTVHFLDFTQFGKEFDPIAKKYVFTPYNDIDRTLGFNILSKSVTNIVNHNVVTSSTLMSRNTYFAGVIDDHIPAYLQNRVIHRGNLKQNKLQPVPRRVTDTPESITFGPTSNIPIVGYSSEYFMRMHYEQERDGYDERVLAPYFIGGGFVAGTLNQELFFHAGIDVSEWELPRHVQCYALGVRSVGLGGMVREGVVLPGLLMPDLTADYTTAQGVLRVLWAPWSYPIRLDFAVTTQSGYFVAKRTAAERQIISELPTRTRDSEVYQAKSPMRERYLSMRVGVGNLTFETYNDSYGGKDKGPSYGVQLSYHVSPTIRAQQDTLGAPRRARATR